MSEARLATRPGVSDLYLSGRGIATYPGVPASPPQPPLHQSPRLQAVGVPLILVCVEFKRIHLCVDSRVYTW
jgi:hypothetical protein